MSASMPPSCERRSSHRSVQRHRTDIRGWTDAGNTDPTHGARDGTAEWIPSIVWPHVRSGPQAR